VKVIGEYTKWQMNGTKFDFGRGVTVKSGPIIPTPTEAYVVLAVAKDAPVDRTTVTATTGAEILQLPQAFAILRSPTEDVAQTTTPQPNTSPTITRTPTAVTDTGLRPIPVEQTQPTAPTNQTSAPSTTTVAKTIPTRDISQVQIPRPRAMGRHCPISCQ
jgi:hypothetical protein